MASSEDSAGTSTLAGSIPSHYTLLYSANQIRARVEALGVQVAAWARESGKVDGRDVLVVPVLRGGLFLCADLVRALPLSVELEVTRASAYDESSNSLVAERLRVDVSGLDVEHRSVLLVDDILESGSTLATLSGALKARGAREVRSCVLIWRQRPEATIDPDWFGFMFRGPEWVVGYGMDDRGRFRNLPDIYILGQTS